jgi:hypothetical protein
MIVVIAIMVIMVAPAIAVPVPVPNLIRVNPELRTIGEGMGA